MNDNVALPAVEIQSLRKTYGEKKNRVNAVVDFSCKIHKGEIVGLLGPNGAGKTTLIKMIMGFTNPDSGKICFNGKEKKFGDPRYKPFKARNHTPEINTLKLKANFNTGYLPENFRPNPYITVKEYILFLFGLSNICSRLAKSKTKTLLKKFDIEHYSDRRISTLSKGMGQRLGIAQAFVGELDMIVLDEPTSGLDPVGRNEVIEFMLDQKKNNKTIFLCSHILSEVEQVCDKIGILANGRLKIFGTLPSLLSSTKSNNLEEVFTKMVKE